MLIPISGLFETHLTVAQLDQSIEFYRDVIGLRLAQRFDDRRCAFFWVGPRQEAMLGLWEVGSGPQRMQLHIAFRVELDQLLLSYTRLQAAGLAPLDFAGHPTKELVVLCWMPAASIYFRDPDGHLLEFLTMLPSDPRPELGIVSWTDWHRMMPDRPPLTAAGSTD